MKRLVFGITGASGAPYAARALEFLRQHGQVHVDVVFTKTGRLVWNHEVGTDPADYGFPIWNPGDFTAPFASGSARVDAMLVLPCSAGSAGRIAHCLSTDLVGRAADVTLKERRPLVLVVREMPLSLIHLRNLTQLAEAGATVLPASPGFYHRPQSVQDLVDHVVARSLDLVGIDNELFRRWSGLGDADVA
ncbi:MAG: UbiX family flavin prenyltransferase [Myxococcales bacterium]|nr:UbiX family flavin prenyltransferase [Myxococcales bacterium]